MKYTVDYLTDEKIVSIKMIGRLNYQTAEQFSKEAVKLAHKHYCTKYLLNHKETVMPKGSTNLHATGDELQQFGLKNTDKIAIIIESLNGNRKKLEPENRNSSWSDFKYFSAKNLQKAVDWLLETEQK